MKDFSLSNNGVFNKKLIKTKNFCCFCDSHDTKYSDTKDNIKSSEMRDETKTNHYNNHLDHSGIYFKLSMKKIFNKNIKGDVDSANSKMIGNSVISSSLVNHNNIINESNENNDIELFINNCTCNNFNNFNTLSNINNNSNDNTYFNNTRKTKNNNISHINSIYNSDLIELNKHYKIKLKHNKNKEASSYFYNTDDNNNARCKENVSLKENLSSCKAGCKLNQKVHFHPIKQTKYNYKSNTYKEKNCLISKMISKRHNEHNEDYENIKNNNIPYKTPSFKKIANLEKNILREFYYEHEYVQFDQGNVILESFESSKNESYCHLDFNSLIKEDPYKKEIKNYGNNKIKDMNDMKDINNSGNYNIMKNNNYSLRLFNNKSYYNDKCSNSISSSYSEFYLKSLRSKYSFSKIDSKYINKDTNN